DARRRHLLRAGGASTGTWRLSRELAAGRNSARGTAVGALPGTQDRGGARWLRHFRCRILRPRRPGNLLGAVAASARHRNGHPDLAVPEPVRTAPPGDPRAADPLDRARRTVSL